MLKAHFFKILYMALDQHRDLRERLGASLDAEAVYATVATCCEREEAAAAAAPEQMRARCDEEKAPWMSWYRRHRGAEEAPADRYGSFKPPEEQEGEKRDAAPTKAAGTSGGTCPCGIGPADGCG